MGPRGDHTWAGALTLAGLGLFLALGISFLLPITLGGHTLYVTTSGISMEPRFHTGDLAVLRSADSYRVGDVAAYYSELNKTVVMHRIIRIQGNRCTFKGDNNGFIDYDTPTTSQLMGKLAFRVPKGGYAVHLVSSPPVLGVIVFVFITGGRVAYTRRRRRRDRRRAAMAGRPSPPKVPASSGVPRPRAGQTPARPPPRLSAPGDRQAVVPEPTFAEMLWPVAAMPDQTDQTDRTDRTARTDHMGPGTRDLPAALRPLAAVVAVVACLGLSLGAAAWTRPTTATATVRTAASTAGDRTPVTFDLGYRALVRPSAAYDGTEISDPQPIFRKVLERFEVRYVYRGTSGMLRMDAVLSASNGWTSTVPLAAGRHVTGRGDTGSVVLDLADFEARGAAAAVAAGLPASDLKVVVTPSVVGTDGTTFGAALDLAVSPTVVTMAPDQPVTPASDPKAGRKATGLSTKTVPNTVSAFGLHLTVPNARRTSLGSLMFAIVAGLLVAMTVRRSPVLTEPQRIARTYPELLVPVAPLAASPAGTLIEVPDIDSLARLAGSYGLLVLHWESDGVNMYAVQDENTLYRFTIPVTGRGEPAAGGPGSPAGRIPARLTKTV